ncbi:MAG: FecR family protein [Candidatus Symbiothrix sp.]|nr:FecR family protein [Candidatus Symbiothrix sp.]
MQYNENEIRRLAQLYWEGKLPLKDEVVLFEFISSNEVNKEKYRSWEEEWNLLQERDLSLNRKWRRLQNRIWVRENLSEEVAGNRLIPLWKKWSAAAAVALLIISTTIGIHELTLRNNKEIFTVDVPMGQKSKLTLPDGSAVWLNAGSQIQYTGNYNLRNRTLALTGEAYFEVAKQTNKPFIVKLRDYDIEVKGTKFNVSSYNNEKYVSASLMEGAILLRYNNKEYAMKPGETIRLDVETKQLTLHQTNTIQYRSWTEDRLEYGEITLAELFNRLSRQYNVRIHTDAAVDTNKTLCVSFNNRETIDEILYGISKVASIRYKCERNDIYVSKK